jgi:hypothetical protein
MMDDLESTGTAANSSCIGTLLICPYPHLLEMTFLPLVRTRTSNWTVCTYSTCKSLDKILIWCEISKKVLHSSNIVLLLASCFLLLSFCLVFCSKREERLIGLIASHFSECITSHSFDQSQLFNHCSSLTTHLVMNLIREVAKICIANESVNGERGIKSMP